MLLKFDDRITIVYNTSLNPATKIYNKPKNDPNDNPNDSGITIYKQDIKMSENDIKNCRLTFRSNDNYLAKESEAEFK